jgi:hypothetical protein
MTADLLRRAATRLRENATAMPAGPYIPVGQELLGIPTMLQDPNGTTVAWTGPISTPHFSAWTKETALATADLLDAYADGFHPGSRTEPAGRVGPRILTLARAVLQEDRP